MAGFQRKKRNTRLRYGYSMEIKDHNQNIILDTDKLSDIEAEVCEKFDELATVLKKYDFGYNMSIILPLSQKVLACGGNTENTNNFNVLVGLFEKIILTPNNLKIGKITDAY